MAVANDSTPDETPSVRPTNEAPPKRAVAPKLTKAQRARVRELIEDEGHSRKEALAWVLAFEPALAKETR